ncbi:dynein regulatory complex protein 9 isoform X2 [Alligator mississippiensis]|uniref:dynein regulatory complex protein 9 isoform X2 n=1 Tax=Alligator mississippiensis TaxID=8496 RepID=UPI0009073450|nr:dynein regulatory complex protein 9 isoform X2 [Alligator mississippiensis]
METGPLPPAAAAKDEATTAVDRFSPLEILQLSALLEDCLDQLSILGYILPRSYEGRTEIIHMDSQEVSKIVKTQKELGMKYEELVSAMPEKGTGIPSEKAKINQLRKQLQETRGDLQQTNFYFNSAAKQSVLSSDNIRKILEDMQYASRVIAETLLEIETSGTFQSLLQAVEREKEKKNNLHNLIIREEKGRKEMKSLQKQLQEVKKEMELELQNRTEMIAYLKDQLQEMKAKTDMESRYIKKNTELQVFQTQKKCGDVENDLYSEIEMLRTKTDEEVRTHMEIENFLKEQQLLEEKLEYWMEKYEKDTEAKQQELNALKTSKANNLAMLQDLARQCRLFEQVILEDRVEKEAARQKMERDALELKSVLKLQAWWRGTMVRRSLGPYKVIVKKAPEGKAKGKDKGKKEARVKK